MRYFMRDGEPLTHLPNDEPYPAAALTDSGVPLVAAHTLATCHSATVFSILEHARLSFGRIEARRHSEADVIGIGGRRV